MLKPCSVKSATAPGPKPACHHEYGTTGVLRPAPTFDFDVVGGVELRLRLEWHVEVRDDDQHLRLVRRGEDVRLMLGARAGTHYATAISTCSAPAKPSEVKNFAKSLRRFCLRSTIVSTNVSAI